MHIQDLKFKVVQVATKRTLVSVVDLLLGGARLIRRGFGAIFMTGRQPTSSGHDLPWEWTRPQEFSKELERTGILALLVKASVTVFLWVCDYSEVLFTFCILSPLHVTVFQEPPHSMNLERSGALHESIWIQEPGKLPLSEKRQELGRMEKASLLREAACSCF